MNRKIYDDEFTQTGNTVCHPLKTVTFLENTLPKLSLIEKKFKIIVFFLVSKHTSTVVITREMIKITPPLFFSWPWSLTGESI